MTTIKTLLNYTRCSMAYSVRTSLIINSFFPWLLLVDFSALNFPIRKLVSATSRVYMSLFASNYYDVFRVTE